MFLEEEMYKKPVAKFINGVTGFFIYEQKIARKFTAVLMFTFWKHDIQMYHLICYHIKKERWLKNEPKHNKKSRKDYSQ